MEGQSAYHELRPPRPDALLGVVAYPPPDGAGPTQSRVVCPSTRVLLATRCRARARRSGAYAFALEPRHAHQRSRRRDDDPAREAHWAGRVGK
eukprot:5377596-Pleurochrysis_carterae.AAC.1